MDTARSPTGKIPIQCTLCPIDAWQNKDGPGCISRQDRRVTRGLKMPDLVIVDGAPGLDAALAALRSDVAVQGLFGQNLNRWNRL